MNIEDVVIKAVESEMEKIARQIEADLKAEVEGHFKSGAAYRAIHIEKRGLMRYFIGGTDGTGKGKTGTDHLAMLDQGNGGRGKVIKPKYSKALRITDGFGNTRAFRKQVRGYDGFDIIEKVASKYR